MKCKLTKYCDTIMWKCKIYILILIKLFLFLDFLTVGAICLALSWAKTIPENPEALRTVSNGMSQFAKEFYKVRTIHSCWNIEYTKYNIS